MCLVRNLEPDMLQPRQTVFGRTEEPEVATPTGAAKNGERRAAVSGHEIKLYNVVLIVKRPLEILNRQDGVIRSEQMEHRIHHAPNFGIGVIILCGVRRCATRRPIRFRLGLNAMPGGTPIVDTAA